MVNQKYRNRRLFLKRALAGALVGSGAGAFNGKLSLLGSAMAQSSSIPSDYRALVCVFLYGGADSFNLFIPAGQDLFARYQQARGQLALNRESLNATRDGGLLMHPALGRLRDRYDKGQMLIVGNTGNLIEPVTRQAMANGTVRVPKDLFAHNHQQEQWQKAYSSRPAALVDAGWGGRMADLLDDFNGSSSLPPVYNLNGSNYFSPGRQTVPASVDPRYGVKQLPYLDVETSASNASRDRALAEILALPADNLLQQFAGESLERARDNAALLKEVLDNNGPSGLDFNTKSSIGSQLQMVARLIAGQKMTGQRRQIFFVGMGGWDTHDAQSPRLDLLAADLDLALDSFQQELESLEVAGNVTTFTASDFGRTLTINGDGSDHGWGGHYLVMGDAVRGEQFVGDWPSFEIGGLDDVGNKGRVIPQLSVNQYGASLTRWMGLSVSDIETIFPDLTAFDRGWENQYGIFSS